MRDGVLSGTTVGLSYNDLNASASTTYTYTVTAQDAAGNVGPASNGSTVTTPGASTAITNHKVGSFHPTSAGTSIAVGRLATTGTNELLRAFVTPDGPTGRLRFSRVTGAT